MHRMHQAHSEQGFRDSMLSVSLARNVTSGGSDKRLRGTRTGQCKPLAQPQQQLKLKSLLLPVYTSVFRALQGMLFKMFAPPRQRITTRSAKRCCWISSTWV